MLQHDHGILRRSHTRCASPHRDMRLTFARSTLEWNFSASQPRCQLYGLLFAIPFYGVPDIRHFTLWR